MVYGIGTDILKISNIERSVTNPNDPFIQKAYTSDEITLINRRQIPLYCFATRLAGKEAVSKCLNISGNDVRLNEIEILENENGQPYVVLHGGVKQLADLKKIKSVQISLSYDTDYAIAYAIAEI